MMGVEGHLENPSYMCPLMPGSPPLVLGPASYTTFATPGATIDQFSYAWRLDYHRETRPQRVLLVTGLNDLHYHGEHPGLQRQ